VVFELTEHCINGSNLSNHNDYDNQEPKNVEDHQAVLNLGPNLSSPDIDDVENDNHGKYQERALV